MERQRGSMLSVESSSLKSDNDMSNKVPSRADETIYSPQDKRKDHLSPESSEFRRLQKIEKIKALKQKKQQKKKKMMA